MQLVSTEYQKRRRIHDETFNLMCRVVMRIGNALWRQGAVRADSVPAMVGCSWGELKIYIEGKFKDGMSWTNRNLWQIDHIKPIALFDLTDPDQQRQCFHHSNLQPLWRTENQKKHTKYPYNPVNP